MKQYNLRNDAKINLHFDSFLTSAQAFKKTFFLTTAIRIYAILLLLFFISIQRAQATHYMGADLTYACIGNNTYEISLTLYRDCSGVIIYNTSSIVDIYSASCGFNAGVLLYLESVSELSPLCDNQLNNSTCNGGGLVGVEQYVFKGTYTFPQNCTDWRISHGDCCRNDAITNSISPDLYDLYVEATLNNLDFDCNSSPIFTIPPVTHICVGQPLVYSHGAFDPEGDSLSFSLAAPLDNANTTVPYTASFTPTYPISTYSGVVDFDTQTGQLGIQPDMTQVGIIAILVEEYRDGVWVGSTIRDMQIIVLNCTNHIPLVSPPTNVSGGEFYGTFFEVIAGDLLSFDVVAVDPDTGDIMTVTDNITTTIPNAALNVTGTNPITINFTWQTASSDQGNYNFAFIVEDDNCPIIGAQIPEYIIQVKDTTYVEDSIVYVKDTELAQLFHIFPNPNSGIFLIELEGNAHPEIEIAVLDILGQVVFQKDYAFHTGQLTTRIDLNNASSGTYFVQISAADQVSYQKVVVR